MISRGVKFVSKRLIPAFMLVSSLAHAAGDGGIAVLGTRVIFNEGAGQTAIKVMNSSKISSFLIQSWVEDAGGKKTSDFVVTPPLYMSSPGDTNSLRLVYVGPARPQDKETLYYFVEKSIPSVDKEKLKGQNTVLIATATRLKLFYRPANLTPSVDKAPDTLTFSRDGNKLKIHNPSPYYLTLTGLKSAGKEMKTVMVAPDDNVFVDGLPSSATLISYRTINDFGATTAEITKSIK